SVWPVTVKRQDVRALLPANKQEPTPPATHKAPEPDTHKAVTLDTQKAPEPDTHRAPEPDTHKAPEPDTHKAPEPDTHKPTNLTPKLAKPVPNASKSSSATTVKPK